MKYWGVFFVVVFLVSMMNALPAYAQSLCADGTGTLPRPTTAPITSNMGRRNCSGCSSNHPGTDYGTGVGTAITVPEGCEPVSSGGNAASTGYGYYIQFDCGTNSAGQAIGMQYSHLQSTNFDPATRTLRTGDTGAGGAHLDYVITIDGNTVDAQCSTGTVQSGVYTYGNSSVRHGAACPIQGTPNLCDPDVANALIEHGRQARDGETAPFIPIGSGGGGTPPAPPNGPTGGGVIGGGPSQNPDGSPVSTAGPTGTLGNYDRDPGEPRDPYIPPPDVANCDTSTCITTDTVATAEHENMARQVIMTRIENITGTGACLPPISTGAIVFRQIAGEIEEYPDKFCLNKGCSYEREETCQ